MFNKKTGLKALTKPGNIIRQMYLIRGETISMERYSGINIYNASIQFLNSYNNQIGNKEEINEVIGELNKKEFNNNKYSEIDGYEKFFSELENMYNKDPRGELGVLLSEMVLLDDGTTMDPAAWKDWIDAINIVVNNDNKEDNSHSTVSGDSSSLPLATGVIGALGSLITKKKKNTK